MNDKNAIVYLRWACEPSPLRREEERTLLVRLAEEQGYTAEVLEEVGLPAEVYSLARERLRTGSASALVVRDFTRLGRAADALLEADASMRIEGWRVLTLCGFETIETASSFAIGYARSANRSQMAKRSALARRKSG